MKICFSAGLLFFLLAATPVAGTVGAGTTVSGAITGNTTWFSADGPFRVTGDITVEAGAVLTIEAGVRVEFAGDYGLFVDGFLQAHGVVPGHPVVFTADEAAPGSWKGIHVREGGAAVLRRVEVARAGSGVYAHGRWRRFGVCVTGGALAVENTVIRGSAGDGLDVVSASVFTSAGGQFRDNAGAGVRFTGDVSLVDPAAVFSGNGHDALLDDAWINGDRSWVLPPEGHILLEAETAVAPGSTLTIGPGTVVKFAEGKRLVVHGTLVAGAAAGAPVHFTGWRDGTVGGLGVHGGPAPGDWWGLRVCQGGNATLRRVVIAWAGGGPGAAAVKAEEGSRLEIRDSTVHGSADAGLALAEAFTSGPPVLASAGNTFRDNTGPGVRVGSGASFDDVTSTFAGNGCDARLVDGYIYGEVAWGLGPDYAFLVDEHLFIFGDVSVRPGTKLEFAVEKGVWVYGPDGVLSATGVPGAPVRFLARDQGPGGRWQGITIAGGGTARLEHALVAGTAACGVQVLDGHLALSHSEVRDSAGPAVHLLGAAASAAAADTLLAGSTVGLRLENAGPASFTRCRLADNEDYGLFQEVGDNFDYAANEFSGNGLAPVAIHGFSHRFREEDLHLAAAGSPYRVLGRLVIGAGATVTIAPGVRLEFPEPDETRAQLQIWQGTLRAVGTAAEPIVFSGVDDAPGAWSGILLDPAGGELEARAELAWCEISGGGRPTMVGSGFPIAFEFGLMNQQGNLELRHSVVRGNAGAGVINRGFGPGNLLTAGNTYRDNGVFGFLGLGSGAYFDDAGARFSGNPTAVFLDGAGSSLEGERAWGLDPAYPLRVANISISEDGQLLVRPGTVVRAAETTLVMVLGRLVARGTAAAPIHFTDSADDSVSGAPVEPVAPGWRGIYIADGGAAHLEYCRVGYAGSGAGWQAAAILLSAGGRLILERVRLHDSPNTGLLFNEVAVPPQVSGCTFSGNRVAVAAWPRPGGEIVLAGSIFEDNDEAAVRNNRPQNVIDARGSWWGHVSGPRNATLNPGGLGDTVSDGVLFTPWSAAPRRAEIIAPLRTGVLVAGDSLRFRGRLPETVSAERGRWSFGDGRTAVGPAPGQVGFPDTGEFTVTFGLETGGEPDPFPDHQRFTVVPDPGDLPDLRATAFHAPAELVAGHPVTLAYTAYNAGAGPAGPGRRDAVYLSRDPFPDGGDRLLGAVTVGGELAPGKSAPGEITVVVPAVEEGPWHLVLVLNEDWGILETGRLGGQRAMPVTFRVPVLEHGQARRVAFPAGHLEHHYRVAAPGAANLHFALRDAPPGLELLVRYGSPPAPDVYDYRLEYGQLLLPSATAGDWYVLVRGHPAAAGEYLLEAVLLPDLALTGFFPAVQAAGLELEFFIDGAGFRAPLEIMLVAGSGAGYEAENVEITSPSSAGGVFPAGRLPAGRYTVRVSRGAESVELPAALEILPGAAGRLEVDLLVPSQVVITGPATIYVDYANTGDAPLSAPLFSFGLARLPATGGGTVSSGGVYIPDSRRPDDGELVARLTLDAFRLGRGIWAAGMPEGFSSTADFLASGALPGLLQPGESRRVPVYYAGLADTSSAAGWEWQLSVLSADDPSPADWAAEKDRLRPENLDPAAWAVIWDNFTAQAGTTWGDYVAMLAANARYLHRRGRTVAGVTDLLAFSFAAAEGFSPVPLLEEATDATVAAPGGALVFQRAWPASFSRRWVSGPFGRGWVHNWQDVLAVDEDGTVVIDGGAGSRRVFQPDRRFPGRFLAAPGDSGQLRRITGGFRLAEPGGTVRFYEETGRLGYAEDSNGNRVTCHYDAAGRLVQLAHAAGPGLLLAWSGDRIVSVSDHQGRLTGYVHDGEYLAAVHSFDGRETGYAYHQAAGPARHALAAVNRPGGDDLAFSYDGRGRLAAIGRTGHGAPFRFDYPGTGQVSVSDPAGETTLFSFDQRGRVIRMENPLGEAVGLDYDRAGKLAALVDPDGFAVSFEWHHDGGLAAFTDALRRTSRFAWTRAPVRAASFTDARGRRTDFGYDAAGNRDSVTWPDGSVERFSHDVSGDLVGRISRRGELVSFSRDAVGRLTGWEAPGEAPVAWRYDSRGNLIEAEDDRGVIALGYDGRDRLVRIAWPDGYRLEFEYDVAGRRASLADQSGGRVEYHYDDAGRLARLADAAGDLAVYAYDTLGRPVRKDLRGGAHTLLAWDAAGRLAGLENRRPDGTPVSWFHYDYDRRGRRTVMNTVYGTWTYEYDDAGRLTRAALAAGDPALDGRELVYRYDEAGNRVLAAVDGISENYAVNDLNQYTAAGARRYSYDADGNLVREAGPDGEALFTYDAFNRLRAVTRGGQTMEYEYDALGRRFLVRENDQETRELSDPFGLGTVVGRYDAAGALRARYLHGHGLFAAARADGVLESYFFDPMGNTSEVIGLADTVVESYVYGPFGEVLARGGPGENPFEFMGRLGVTAGAGLNYARARSYLPALGRFLQADPIGLAGGLNLYAYADNNPVSRFDPAGRSGEPGFWEAAWGGVKEALGQVFVPPPYAAAQTLVDSRDDLEHIARERQKLYQSTNEMWQIAFGRDYQEPGRERPGDFRDDKTPDGPGRQPRVPRRPYRRRPAGLVAPVDPNQKLSTPGHGVRNFLPAGRPIGYRVDFENLAEATAPARIVTIRDTLCEHLDLDTLELAGFGFGEIVVPVPPGRRDFLTVITYDYRDDDYDFALEVHFEAWLEGRTLHALFIALDPLSGNLPDDPQAGFLPPEDGTGRGQGYVSYLVSPVAGLPSGTEIRNVATIQFDFTLEIDTNQVDPLDKGRGTSPDLEALVTLDAWPPASRVYELPPVSPAAVFVVSWSGDDDGEGSGIAGYDVYVREDEGPWQRWLVNIPHTAAEFTGAEGKRYAFYTVATDHAGHREIKEPVAEGQTRVDSTARLLTVSPGRRVAASPAGRLSFDVRNAGAGQLEWSAAVTGGDDWLSLVSGGTGTNAGRIVVAYAENTAPGQRAGEITVSAPLATGETAVSVEVVQFGRLHEDVTGRGAVTLADVIEVLRRVVDPPAGDPPPGDVDGDGRVTVEDAAWILRKVLDRPAWR